MRKLMILVASVATVLALSGSVARADMDNADPNMSGTMALGWWDSSVPVALQIGMGPKMALDLGIGFNKPDAGDTGFNIGAALPITMFHKDARAQLNFRPGIIYMSKPGGADSIIEVNIDLEARVWLTDRFSILAGHGLQLVNSSYPSPLSSTTDIRTRAISATQVGFWFTISK